MTARSPNWCFTSFKELNIENLKNNKNVRYCIFQKEKAPSTEKIHWQGYIELNNKYSMQFLKQNVFEDYSIHLETRKGTQEQAINYCKKKDTQQEEPVEFGEKKKAGKRSDITEILNDINDGDTMQEILATHEGNALRMIHCIEKAMKVKHGLYALDDYIRLQRKKNKDPLDEKIEDDLYKKLYN